MKQIPDNAHIAIVGAGAAGCFCAVELKRRCPAMTVTVLEAGPKALAKVAVTGGGRCNLTNTFRGVSSLEEVYPRGFRLMRRVFGQFSPEDTVAWWEGEGVRLAAQDDECIFPESQDAMQIVGTLMRLMRESGVRLKCGSRVERIECKDGGMSVVVDGGDVERADAVVVTAGGCKSSGLRAMLPREVEVTDTVPSLFTLKIADDALRSLMGTVVEHVGLRLAGTRFSSEGTLLVTDWGVSGPATLRLSSYAARHLAGCGYQGNLIINWLDCSEDDIKAWIDSSVASCGRRTLSNVHPQALTSRLWLHILRRCGLREDLRWAELGGKSAARLVNELSCACYPVCGRARFKEEFVTCGGVDLSGVDPATLESRKVPGLFFAGEVLDVDAVTGGFNLQAAWSMAMVVAMAIGDSYAGSSAKQNSN